MKSPRLRCFAVLAACAAFVLSASPWGCAPSAPDANGAGHDSGISSSSDDGAAGADAGSADAQGFGDGSHPDGGADAAIPSGTSTIRIAVGESSAYTDPQGHVWAADNAFTSGLTATQSPPVAIAATDAPQLYNSQRYGSDVNGRPITFSYELRASPGAYVVTLKFAEAFVAGPGLRLFSVALNGAIVLDQFDIYATAGGAFRALDESFPVVIGSQGLLEIAFEPGKIQSPMVNAIALTPADAFAGDASLDAASSSDASASLDNFRISNGAIFGPSGNPWAGRGIDLFDSQMATVSTSSAATPLLTAFPGLKIVRVACYAYNAPSYYKTFIDQLTAQHIVVELENHMGPAGQSAGGGSYTGSGLTTETSWYAALAAAYANNPYVWFGTLNEPSGATSDIVAEHVAIYEAVRTAGSGSIVMLMQMGGWSSNGFPQASYSGMTNVLWDTHFYPWVANYTADLTANETALANQVANAQTVISADGTVPVIVGEYGDSSSGATVDTGGTEAVQAVGDSKLPCMAWAWEPGGGADVLTDGSGNLTSPYGQQIAAIIAGP